MRKIQYISLVLLLIYVVTLVNLFYKSWWYDVQSTLPTLFQGGTGLCPLYGYKCPTDDMCDCSLLCVNGEHVPFRVLPTDPIYLMDRQLEPGTYCLPKGIGGCNQRTSHHIFSSTGWKCVPRNASLYYNDLPACHTDKAADNSQNVLWDYLLNKPAQDIDNAYETLADGKTLRYRCQCGSLDMFGKVMVESIPFVCSVDYCIQDFLQPLPGMGFNGSVCECAMYKHQDEQDKRSPCVIQKTRVEQNVLTGRVDCTTETSWIKRSIFCPPNRTVLSFETLVGGSSQLTTFVRQRLT